MSDFDDFDDFETAGGPASAARAELAAKFNRRVDEALKILSATRKATPEQRQKMAYWLGNCAEPKAITKLAQAYRKDPDPGVRRAAAYALGQFRALEKHLEEDSESAIKLVESIVYEGRQGRRSPISARMLVFVQLGLVVSLVLLLGAGALLSGGLPAIGPEGTADAGDLPTSAAVATEADSPGAVLFTLQSMYNQLLQDADTLQQQFDSIEAGSIQDCTVNFNAPDFYTPPPGVTGYSGLMAALDQIAAAQVELSMARSPFSDACASLDVPLLGPTSIAGLRPLLDTARSSLAAVPPLLNAPDVLATPELPTATPEPTEQATDTPVPTINPATVNTHILSLDFIISEMNTPVRGKNNILLGYWNDAAAAGATDGCREPRPEIPDDYILPEDQIDRLPEALVTAADTVNLALQLTRDAWTLFETSCANNTLRASAAQGRITTELAATAYDEALIELNKAR